MNEKKIIIGVSIIGLMYFLLVGFIESPGGEYVNSSQDQWMAPASADKIINPIKNDPNAVASGKKLYKALCFVCHGPQGKGDGPGGVGLTPKPANFSTKAFQAQSDGAIYWKIEQGRSPMPSYKTSIPERKRWEIINYIRTLKK